MHSPGRTPTRLRTLLTAVATGLIATGGLMAAGMTGREAPAATAVPISVDDADGLREALAGARPGDTIRLADGRYHGSFEITASGTSGSRITLTGSSKAVLTASGGYGLRLNGASYWTVRGITVNGGKEGIRIDGARGVTVDSVSVSVRRHGHA
ncbi:hypothetical protein [Streptomyces rapamycinicus]|uniref:Uncharacterized protein n=2 Tax=Streptomyces rapamycinicus TaxID=1226757 RepID=A0A0A0NV10_STRRN|nr:hypothetical protein M271_36460 [Streptomyces rapamycinicus NRRL 5491]MBB4786409.1 nitrous oxidase accessory protein NosD [Streptomyces rapamycinicus]RLV78131.1 hypothetical protein D3C57_107140 [Streptomyces rapamycinicus NRRL 5491]